MPRRKASRIAGQHNASKRWCSDKTKENTSNSSAAKNLNKRFSSVESHVNTSFKNESEFSNCESPNYVLVDISMLSKLFTNQLCNECKHPTLKVQVGRKFGFCHQLKVVCESCEFVENETYSSKQISKHQDKPNKFDINLRMVQAFMSFGKGFAALEKFCLFTNLHLMSSRTFNSYKEMLNTSISKSTEKHLQIVRSEVKEAYGATEDEIVDISVSFDGTWLTRGHTSQIGIGCVIDIQTGYVVDFHVMSKYCRECDYSRKELGDDSAEFNIWYGGHKDVCNINHTGSSGAMEVQAATELWSRSESIGFRYTTVLSDGDSKAYNHLNDLEVYGKNVKIEKEECVNHVGKRLYKGLMKCVQVAKARGVTLGGRSYGSLKEETIKALTRYYKNAIIKNEGNTNAMKASIFASLYHTTSTDEKPQHSKCPPGDKSWCFYQQAVAKGKTPAPHKTMIRNPVLASHLPYIMPVYQRLASDELLKRCSRCATQNANESLHSVIWSKCSKVASACKKRVNIAVCDAVSEFNVGTLKSLQMLQDENSLPMNKQSRHLALVRDYRRMYQRKRRKAMLYSLVQKKIKLARKRMVLAQTKAEGHVYLSGGH